MYLIYRPGFIFLVLYMLEYVNCDDTPGPYDPGADDKHKRCKKTWVVPTNSNGHIVFCSLKCKPKCKYYKGTGQYRCRTSITGYTQKCECCTGEFHLRNFYKQNTKIYVCS